MAIYSQGLCVALVFVMSVVDEIDLCFAFAPRYTAVISTHTFRADSNHRASYIALYPEEHAFFECFRYYIYNTLIYIYIHLIFVSVFSAGRHPISAVYDFKISDIACTHTQTHTAHLFHRVDEL